MKFRTPWSLTDVLTTLIALSPAIGAILLYDRLPNVLVSHINFNNTADGYTSKSGSIIMLVLLGLVPLVIRLARHMDPNRANFEKFAKAYEVTRVGTSLILAIAGWGMLLYNLNIRLQMNAIILGLIGLMLMVMGNYMTQVQPNYTFGIRTPWTLSNPEVWRKTHRFGGPMMMLGGASALVAAWVDGVAGTVIFLTGLIISVISPVLYSYLLYRKLNK
ncbi:SdpI family protein [Paenibacillus polymyxa]|uniref:SdpI family protein n=1 Tax=Paenibacillus polymyxa TaxID=1406 RepID=UPI0004DA6A77|nr:SdpI family protein [Paenibacillus polymyxa]KEO78137.1 membrane protein [Paenibacillus polymyxa]MCH6189732.1 SdpI family protein [Paenibacillus polymyxa]WRL61081.1 SdpI family protein [Paenibacillus polymyxa]